MDLSHKKSILLLTISLIIIFAIVYPIISGGFEQRSYNFMMKTASVNKKASNDIILIVIDNKSLAELGRWPWKRTRYVQIFDYLNKYTNAKVYGFDSLIAAPDVENSSSDKQFFDAVKGYDKLVAGMMFDTEGFEDEKTASKYNQLLREKNDIEITDKRTSKSTPESRYHSFTKAPIEYMKNISKLGVVTIPTDEDGYIRRVHQLVSYDDGLFPSMPLAMYSKVTGIKEFTLTDKFLTGQNDKYWLKMPTYTDRDGTVYSYLSFYDMRPNEKYSHETVSAVKVIKSLEAINAGQKPILDPKIFDNKIVFIGAFAHAQGLEDIKRTPVSESFPGIDIQATNFNNIYKNDFYTKSSEVFNFLMALTLFLLAFLVILVMPVSVAFLSMISAMLLFIIFAYTLFLKNIAINVLSSVMFIFIATGFGYSYRFILEGRKKERVQSAMGKYISKDVMKNVIDNIDIKDVALGGKRANVTVLFIDIRGFTTISERLSAQEVAVILNEYFSALVPIIDKNNGILNKFMGDAILAVFGEPIQDENHPVNAVKCADEMLRVVKNLQEKWLNEGKPRIDAGIGIATGDAFVGNIGSEERLEYTVIGDTVNTASRIENYNKVYKTKFLISEETFERVQKYVDVIKIRDVSVRGKAKKINIYEVLRLIK